MIIKVISGGQTGADRAGLIAAKALNLETGGWMPKGFKALDGNHPEFAELYGIKEHPSPLYPPRTELNVQEANATIRLAVDFNSPGERCTLKAIQKYNKPYLDIDLNNNQSPTKIGNWILANDFKIINIAGNTESTKPGLQQRVVELLVAVFAQREQYLNV